MTRTSGLFKFGCPMITGRTQSNGYRGVTHFFTMSFVLALIVARAPAQQTLHPTHHDAAQRLPGTIVVPAADFLATIPANDTIDGRFPAGQWLFNNSTINMAAPEDLTASVTIKEAGTYHLYVRALGTAASSFKVSIDGRQDPTTFGNAPLALQKGGDFTLKPGLAEIRLTAIAPRPAFNVLVLTKSATLTDDDLKPLELSPEVKLLHEYKIAPSNIVKFGDVDGSGKYAILDITSDYSSILYGNDGHELWRWQAPAQDARLRGEFEAPGVMWDFQHNGRDQVAQWRILDGIEYIVLADGRTGDILKKVSWPVPPIPKQHVYNNYRMAVAKFHKESDGPDTLLVLSDTGGLISLTAYDFDLNQVWQHSEPRAKDYFGHYIYPYDVNGDGIDEVLISHLCLDSHGNEVWNNAKYFEKNNDHMDAMEFFDINGDGKPELLVGQSDVGTLAYNAQSGDMLWQNVSDHSQQVTAGFILADSKTPQVVTNGRTYSPTLAAQLYWFDSAGRLLERWPAHPLNGNPNFVRGDWYGTGKRTYFWYRFRLEPDGASTLYFKGEAYHMFDFDHTGADQVITMENGGGGGGGGNGGVVNPTSGTANAPPTQTLRVYGNANISPHPKPCNADCRKLIANHTHY